MQPYQSYFPQTYNSNPYFQQVAQQGYMQQAYPQQNFQQQMQQVQAQPVLNGKIVDDFSVLTANDVPMDGNGALFIKKDGAEIQLRHWTAQGTIQTTSYKPLIEDKATGAIKISGENENLKFDLSDEATGAFMQRFDEIASRIDTIEQILNKPTAKTTSQRAKKEAGAE